MAHFLSCRLLDEACTADDLATMTERAMECALKWGKNGVKDTKEEAGSVVERPDLKATLPSMLPLPRSANIVNAGDC